MQSGDTDSIAERQLKWQAADSPQLRGNQRASSSGRQPGNTGRQPQQGKVTSKLAALLSRAAALCDDTTANTGNGVGDTPGHVGSDCEDSPGSVQSRSSTAMPNLAALAQYPPASRFNPR